jgi:hypothetical protein
VASVREPCSTPLVDTVNELAVKNMSADDRKRTFRNELLLASTLVATGLVIAGLSLHEIRATNRQQLAQATQPTQATPSPTPTNEKPAESKPGGDRPTTPAPQPARPDADAQKSGAQPALPPAPAEKTAPPIRERQ